jgi:hypothetical protein
LHLEQGGRQAQGPEALLFGAEGGGDLSCAGQVDGEALGARGERKPLDAVRNLDERETK